MAAQNTKSPSVGVAQYPNARVRIEYDCTECKGTGSIQNYIWKEYYDTHSTEEINKMDDAEMRSWFVERGYPSDPYRIPEEIECPECEGDGYRVKAIELTKFLKLIK